MKKQNENLDNLLNEENADLNDLEEFSFDNKTFNIYEF